MILSNRDYYQNAVIGKVGDFITAPEVSDVFNMILGKAILSHALKKKSKLLIIELGGGTGKMMRDILRLFQAYTDNNITTTVSAVFMLEQSASMRENQEKNIDKDILSSCPIEWFSDLDTLVQKAQLVAEETNSTVVVISNEFFDTLPMKQFHLSDKISELHARCLEENNIELIYREPSECSTHLIEEYVRKNAKLLNQIIAENKYAIVELSPVREMYLNKLLDIIIPYNGMFLTIDYGHFGYKHTDSIKFIKNHKLLNNVRKLGETDISSAVDFYALAKVAIRRNCIATFCSQSDFLKKHGIFDIAKDFFHKFLDSDIHAKYFEQMWLDTAKLTSKLDMGGAFKVLNITNSPVQKTGFKRCI